MTQTAQTVATSGANNLRSSSCSVQAIDADSAWVHPHQPDPTAVKLARTVIGRRWRIDHRDHNRLERLAREVGLSHERLYFGPSAAEAKSVLDHIAELNLKSASTSAILRSATAMQRQLQVSMVTEFMRFDKSRLGGPGAAGRERDRQRRHEARMSLKTEAGHLASELARRSDSFNIAPTPVRSMP